MRRTFELSRETAALMVELRKLEIGEVMTYDDIQRVTGKDPRKCRWILQTARKRVWHDDSVYTATVAKVGIQRINETDAARSQEAGLRHIHRSALSHERKARVIDVTEIPVDERAVHVARTTMFSFIGRATNTRSKDRILAAVNVQEQRQELDLKKALAALMP